MAHVLVIGGSFAGLTAALETRRKLGKQHTVTLLSKTALWKIRTGRSYLP